MNLSPAYEMGEQVEIYYNPEEPEKAQIKGFWSQYWVVMLLAAFGMVGVGFGIYAVIESGRKSK